jgi:glucose/arabinose dehydrogenase
VAQAIKPDYALGNHVAALGVTFSAGTLLPEQFRKGALIGEHGSWNRVPKSGYKVIFVSFANGRPSGPLNLICGLPGEPSSLFLSNPSHLMIQLFRGDF